MALAAGTRKPWLMQAETEGRHLPSRAWRLTRALSFALPGGGSGRCGHHPPGPLQTQPPAAPVHLSSQGLSAVCASGPGKSRQRCFCSGALIKPTAGAHRTQELTAHSSWGWRSEIRVWAGQEQERTLFPDCRWLPPTACSQDSGRETERERWRRIGREKQRVRDGAQELGSVSPQRGTLPLTGPIL